MKALILNIILLFITTNQTFKLKEFYVADGVIINNYQKWPFIFARNSFEKKYEVQHTDIIEAEKYIQINYYQYEKRLLNHFNSNFNIEKCKSPSQVKHKFKKYNRQYSGFLDQNNDTIIYVMMMDFKNRKRAIESFSDWQNDLVMCFDNCEKQEYFLYNKSQKKLEDTFN